MVRHIINKLLIYNVQSISSELYEARRWNEDPQYWTPMALLDNNHHVYIGDIVSFKGRSYKELGKIHKFIEVCISVALTMMSW